MEAEPRFQVSRPVATTLRIHEAIKLRLRSHNFGDSRDDCYRALLLSALLTVAARLVEALLPSHLQ